MEALNKVFEKSLTNWELLKTTNFNKEELFNSFRSNSDVYGFIDNGDYTPNVNIINISLTEDSQMYGYYLKQIANRKKVGYDNSSPPLNAAYTDLDSRHIMMSIILFKYLPNKTLDTVVEIGGGYGNFFYINRNRDFKEWYIIDMPHLGGLQDWYLQQLDVDKSKYKIVSAFDYPEMKNVDLVIGTHSLSELGYSIFKDYFEKIIINSKYFFYCFAHTEQFKELDNLKFQLINEHFTLLTDIPSERGRESNRLYVRKSATQMSSS